jgi:hypothetical protein
MKDRLGTYARFRRTLTGLSLVVILLIAAGVASGQQGTLTDNSTPENGITVGNTQLVMSHGKVGFGTANPEGKLDIIGGPDGRIVLAGTENLTNSNSPKLSLFSQGGGGDTVNVTGPSFQATNLRTAPGWRSSSMMTITTRLKRKYFLYYRMATPA